MATAEHISDWVQQHATSLSLPWLVIGKGPSYASLQTADFRGRFSLGLNHIAHDAQLPKLDMLHIFDVDVIRGYSPSLLERVQWLVVPSLPNEPHKVPLLKGTFHRKSQRRLAELMGEVPVLQAFSSAGRLLTYDRSDDPAASRTPPVQVGSFSGSTVVSLLINIGVRKVVLAGIDGGRRYAPAFDELNKETLLTAGQPDFEAQFREIAALRFGSGIDIQPLRSNAMATVYVGAEQAQGLATKVLRHSIERRSTYTPTVLHLGERLAESEILQRVDLAGLPSGTPFSLQRFAIPELNERRGRAIYLDSDMLVFDDIRNLSSFPVEESGVAAAEVDPRWNRAPQISVLVIDCERCRWSLDSVSTALREGSLDYEALMRNGPDPAGIHRSIPPQWNSLESFVDGTTSLVHYTDMNSQPWLSAHNRNGHVWCEQLQLAISDRAISEEEVATDVARGYVRPSLLWQVRESTTDPRRIPPSELRRDRAFVPPHQYGSAVGLARAAGLGSATPSNTEIAVRRYYATARHYFNQSGASRGTKAMKHLAAKLRRAVATNLRR